MQHRHRIIAPKWSALCSGSESALGCRRRPAGYFTHAGHLLSLPLALSQALNPLQECVILFQRSIPQTAARLENSAALIRDGTAAALSVPWGGVWQCVPRPALLSSLIHFTGPVFGLFLCAAIQRRRQLGLARLATPSVEEVNEARPTLTLQSDCCRSKCVTLRCETCFL